MTYENIMTQMGKIWKNIQTTQTKETLAQLSAEDKQLLVLMQKILKAQQAGQTQAEVLALVGAAKIPTILNSHRLSLEAEKYLGEDLDKSILLRDINGLLYFTIYRKGLYEQKANKNGKHQVWHEIFLYTKTGQAVIAILRIGYILFEGDPKNPKIYFEPYKELEFLDFGKNCIADVVLEDDEVFWINPNQEINKNKNLVQVEKIIAAIKAKGGNQITNLKEIQKGDWVFFKASVKYIDWEKQYRKGNELITKVGDYIHGAVCIEPNVNIELSKMRSKNGNLSKGIYTLGELFETYKSDNSNLEWYRLPISSDLKIAQPKKKESKQHDDWLLTNVSLYVKDESGESILNKIPIIFAGNKIEVDLMGLSFEQAIAKVEEKIKPIVLRTDIREQWVEISPILQKTIKEALMVLGENLAEKFSHTIIVNLNEIINK